MAHKVTLIRGDGTGPEIIEATLRVLEATKVAIDWDEQVAGQAAYVETGKSLPRETINSIRRNGVALKAPLTTPVGSGFPSVNVALRKEFDLYANLRPAKTYKGVKSRYENIDLVLFRENTEDLYAGVEHMVGDDAAESIKIITRKGSERIARFAFEWAKKEGRKKVTAIHKANIMKFTDGLFLQVCGEVAAEFPEIEYEDRIVDNMSMQLVQKPELYDVMVTENLYGDILSDLCAGLVGGLGVAPAGNYGASSAIFEAVHGSAPKYTGMNRVNPTALILSSALMLKHLGETDAAREVEAAITQIIAEGRNVTYDLGGTAGTSQMGEAVAKRIETGI